MIAETRIRPRGPYSLALSATAPPCPTRRYLGGVLEAVFRTPAGPAHALVRQSPDGSLQARVDAPATGEALEALRVLLAADRDPTPFYAAVADDPLLGPATRRLRGYRPLPLGSAAHGLVRGVCGQLVTTRAARRAESAAARAVGTPHAGLVLPLTADEVRRLAPLDLVRGGLAERRAVALVRGARALPLDDLAGLDTPALVARITANPGLGPWTAGVVALSGLGRWDHGLVGDLGLVRLLAARRGAVPTVEDTAALLDAHAPWQGIASLYLLRGAAGARIPAPPGAVAAATRRRRYG